MTRVFGPTTRAYNKLADDLNRVPLLASKSTAMPTMLNQTRVTSQIDDDMLRRLIHAIEEVSNNFACEFGHESGPQAVEHSVDGDLFIAYQEVRALMVESYPELYGDESL